MKILWIVNIIFPYPTEKLGYKKNVFGGWLHGLSNSLMQLENIDLAIATTYNGKELLEYKEKNIIYYLLPCKNNLKYDVNLEKYWKIINDKFKPDLTHIHGTEYAHGLAFQNACPNIKTVTSIQGLISMCANNYISGIKHKDIIKNITLKDIIKKNIYQEQEAFFKRGKIELEILKKSTAIIGRTEWDYASSVGLINEDKYYKCNETLRNIFYNKIWDMNKIEKNSIFISQAAYPIKGFHVMIEALNIIKNKYKDIIVYVAGENILDNSSLKKKLKLSGYAKYLLTLIKKYNLENNIVFLGLLNGEEMCDRLLKSNIYIQTSSIENSSNSLGEAMLLGMPCIASNVGGTSSMLKDKEEGILYPFGDYCLLAHYIEQILENKELTLKLSENARNKAKITHNKEKNVNTIIRIYNEIIEKRK